METTVAIVGAGPTGLTLANLLGAYGVPTVVVERSGRDGGVQYPRAVGIDDDALRTFQQLGLVDEMLPDIIQNTSARFFAASGKTLVTLHPQDREAGWYRRNMFMQQLAEEVLRRGLERYDCVQVVTGTEAVALAQDDDGATLTVTDLAGGGTYDLRAAFVAGADGARSTLRGLLGLRLDGDTYDDPWLILEVDNDPLDEPYSSFRCDPARPIYSGHLPHRHRRWGLMLNPGETEQEVLSPAGLRRLLSPLVPSFDNVNIIRAHVYRHHARLVDRMTVGRVALVGDAAHLMPPWAGQGLNSGIRDATSLAWRIAAVDRGLGTLALLESYHDERHRHARDVIAVSRRFGRIFIPRHPVAVAVRDAFLLAVKRIPALRRPFYERWFRTPLRYAGGLVLTGGSPVAGTRFPQPRVEDAAEVRPMDDVLGPWFSVVSYRCDPASTLTDDALRFWTSLGARFVRVEQSRSVDPARVPAGSYVEDVHGAVGQWFTRHGIEVAVVRPDRCVAAGGRLTDFPRISRDLAALLRR